MSNETLARIQQIWMGVGLFLQSIGVLGLIPNLDIFFENDFINLVFVALGSILEVFQFVRAQWSAKFEAQLLKDANEGIVRTLSTPKLETYKYLPWIKQPYKVDPLKQ